MHYESKLIPKVMRKMKELYLEEFADKLCMFTTRNKYEQEFLLGAVPKGEEELLYAMHCVYGRKRNDAIRETAQCCWEYMCVIEQLMESDGPNCSENRWNDNREGLKENLRACEGAMELAYKYAPEEVDEIAVYVGRCREIERNNRFRILV